MKTVKCDKCGYSWKTASEKIYVTCPSCMRKFKVILKNKKEGDKSNL